MADQVYVTHCLQNDSLKNQTGFGVRAASTEDPELLKFAAEFAAYELPMDMWANDPSPAKAPRRLALVSGPRNTLALIHSAYVGEDTMGRSGNFFTHVLFYPSAELSALDALKSWHAAEWETSYPQRATKTLPKLSSPPLHGNIITDEALTSFLGGKGAGADQDLATLVCPPRLLNDAARCQHLLTKTIEACLAAWHADADSGRNRVYLVAEPGLVALLLYGAARLLPSHSQADWFFSTFENAHRSLRHFRQAFACGTYLSDPQKGLDPDYFRTLGFGLDTFAMDRGSPELAGEPSPVVRILVRLAAEAKWDVIAQMHGCHAPGRVSADSLTSASRLHNLFIKARNEKLTAEELLDIRRSAEGDALIQKNPAVFWPAVVDFAQTHEAVRREFADMIRKRASELAADSGRRLAALDSHWMSLWSLVKAVEPAKERLAKHWLSLLQQAEAEAPDKAYLRSQRLSLLQECQHVYAAPPAGLKSIDELLGVSSAQEFEQLQKAKLPPDWLARSLELGLDADQPAPWIPRVLNTTSDKLLEALASRLMSAKAADDLPRKLQLLVPTVEDYPIFFRLLKSGLVVPPEHVCALLDSLNDVQTGRIAPIWLRDDHVAVLLCSLASSKKGVEAVWFRFCRFVSQDLLFGDAGQGTLFDNLTAARAKSKAGVPRGCAQILDDWALLLALFANPHTASVGADEIAAICERRKLPKPNELLKEYVGKFFLKKQFDDARIDVFAGIFDRVFPAGDADDQHLDRFDSWLDLVRNLPDTKKFALQKYYLKHCAPTDVVRRQLLEERKRVIEQHAYVDVSRELAQKEAAAANSVPAAPAKRRTKMDKRSGWTRYVDLGTLNLVLMSILGIALALSFVFIGAEVGFLKLSRHDLDREIETLQKDLDDQTRDVDSLTKRKMKLEASVDNLQKTFAIQAKEHLESTNQLKKRKQDMSDLQAVHIETEKKMKAFQEQSMSWKNNYDDTVEKLRKLKTQMDELEKHKYLSVDKLFAISPAIKQLGTSTDVKEYRLVFYQQGAFFVAEPDGDQYLTIAMKKKPSEVFLKFFLKNDAEKKAVLEIAIGNKKPDAADYAKAMKALADEPELVIMRGKEIERRFRLTP
jgi:hypothetical protein